MQKFYRQTFILAVLVLALLSMAATPASANHITSANVNLACNSYTITVTGGDLNTPNVKVDSCSLNFRRAIPLISCDLFFLDFDITL